MTEGIRETDLQRWLAYKAACTQARRWVGDKDIYEAYLTCAHSEWLQWLLERLEFVRCTCDISGEDNAPCALYAFESTPPAAIRERYPVEAVALAFQAELERVPA